MINIRNILRELYVLNFKKNENNTKKLINMRKNDRNILNSFVTKNVFASLIL